MLGALALIGSPRLRADECLRRTLALGHVGHIDLLIFDRPVQVLAAILTHPEAANLRIRILGEGLQGTAILALAGEDDFLTPIRRRLRGTLAASEQKLGSVDP